MYVCMYVWLCWVFVSVRGPSPVVASGGHSSSRCAGLSLSRLLIAEHRLQTCRLSNCGSRAELLRGMWDPPRPGLEPVCPALTGRLSTSAPPGKPHPIGFGLSCFHCHLSLGIFWFPLWFLQGSLAYLVTYCLASTCLCFLHFFPCNSFLIS